MNAHSEDAVYLDAIAEVTFTQLVTASGLPESELVELVRYGALVPRNPDATTWTFEARSLVVAKKASRLRHDFELDPHGGQRRPELPRADRSARGGTPRASGARGLTGARDGRPAPDTAALTHVRHRRLVP